MFPNAQEFLLDAYRILTERGVRALAAEGLRELARLLDTPGDPSFAHRNNPPASRPRIAYSNTYELAFPDGAVPARRPTNESDFALEVPFRFPVPATSFAQCAVIIHAYYPDLLPDILRLVTNIPCRANLFISTDTEAKRAQIESQCVNWNKGSVEIRVFPNRGRDIAPKFVGFRDAYQTHDIFLHLHTKRSPHGGRPLKGWRDYLLRNLIGTPEIAASNLYLFEDPRVGVVMPQHFFDVRGILNWGYDYDLARDLLRRMGVALDKTMILEFPSGSMFWGRSAAMQPLLDLTLQFSDFPEESGQIDGTLAHAIERIVVMVAESSHHEWLKVVQKDVYPLSKTVIPVGGTGDIAEARLHVFRPSLTRAEFDECATEQSIPEALPLLSYPSRSGKPRITLLVPTVNPHQTFGGIATALKVHAEIADALGPDFDRAIVTTDASILQAGYASLPDYVERPFQPTRDDHGPKTLVDAYKRKYGRLDLREKDIFIATAWWTAQFAFDLRADQMKYFGSNCPLIYLIQDDEPFFYGWSSRWALAEKTYERARETLAVINSEELYRVMTEKHEFAEAQCVPYRLNGRIDHLLSPLPRERELLVYGRPHAARNVFEIVSDGLFLWQQRCPVLARQWKITFLGESFPSRMLFPIQNAEIHGKVTLEEYANHLNRASVGISLMLSPHPSYPPLEMAEAGLVTITNSYDGKDLTSRFPDLISLPHMNGADLADAIEQAISRAEPHIGEITTRQIPRTLELGAVHPYSADRLAQLVRQLLTI